MICTDSQKQQQSSNFSRNGSQTLQRVIIFLPFFLFFPTLFILQDPDEIPSEPAYRLWACFFPICLFGYLNIYTVSCSLIFARSCQTKLELVSCSKNGRAIYAQQAHGKKEYHCKDPFSNLCLVMTEIDASPSGLP